MRTWLPLLLLGFIAFVPRPDSSGKAALRGSPLGVGLGAIFWKGGQDNWHNGVSEEGADFPWRRWSPRDRLMRATLPPLSEAHREESSTEMVWRVTSATQFMEAALWLNPFHLNARLDLAMLYRDYLSNKERGEQLLRAGARPEIRNRLTPEEQKKFVAFVLAWNRAAAPRHFHPPDDHDP